MPLSRHNASEANGDWKGSTRQAEANTPHPQTAASPPPSSSPASTPTTSGTSIGSTGRTCPPSRSVSSTPTRTSAPATTRGATVTRYVFLSDISLPASYWEANSHSQTALYVYPLCAGEVPEIDLQHRQNLPSWDLLTAMNETAGTTTSTTTTRTRLPKW